MSFFRPVPRVWFAFAAGCLSLCSARARSRWCVVLLELHRCRRGRIVVAFAIVVDDDVVLLFLPYSASFHRTVYNTVVFFFGIEVGLLEKRFGFIATALVVPSSGIRLHHHLLQSSPAGLVASHFFAIWSLFSTELCFSFMVVRRLHYWKLSYSYSNYLRKTFWHRTNLKEFPNGFLKKLLEKFPETPWINLTKNLCRDSDSAYFEKLSIEHLDEHSKTILNDVQKINLKKPLEKFSLDYLPGSIPKAVFERLF